MTRIIAGTWRGHRLATPPGGSTRPTSDRVREALFSRLDHLGVLDGAVVLDLYCGSGALALEALSRGAAEAVLVDSGRRAAQTALRNARDLGVADRARVRAEPAERAVAAVTGPFDLVLADPPYDLAEPDLGRLLALVDDRGLLAPEGVLVVERSSRSPEPIWPAGLDRFDERAYGETTLWLADRG